MDNVKKLLKEYTFHHTSFSDLKQLVELKEKKGLSISLCVPTLNEEKTIGKEIVMFNSELRQRYPLLDEIAVIDSGSTDNTLEVAAAFGADIYLSSDILPEYGIKKGKGENLWKAIYQLKGDIIVYVDADIKNIHPRFVYGLVGPLLMHDNIKYVKAFYQRPIELAKGIRSIGGGRVTEILVRPLFSLFFPELSGIIQPLSGEYAVRRETLERIPFPIGYGVETAHLLDVYRHYGITAFGQTDLDTRIHRNQATLSLGKMAFGILQTFMVRASDHKVFTALPQFKNILNQFESDEENYRLKEIQIVEEERPPMNTVKSYAQRKTELK